MIKVRLWNANKNEFISHEELIGSYILYEEVFDGEVLGMVPLLYSGLSDSEGTELYEGDVVYLAGYGNYVLEFPFQELYDSAAEGDIEKKIGDIYTEPTLKDS